MAQESRMLPLGTAAPAFILPNVSTGGPVSLDDLAGTPALLIMFLCRHCPYVIHVKGELARLRRDYGASDLAMVGISSNDATAYPDDQPDSLRDFAAEEGFGFPLLYDESQVVARAYSAACTPDFFLFGAERKLVYRGQLDDSRPSSPQPVTGASLRAALDAVLNGQQPAAGQRPSVGCSIKWKD